MLGRFLRRKTATPDLADSKLLNEETFYPTLMKDLNGCGSELIIESPFITNRRLDQLLPILQKLKQRKVRVIINTRDPHEHDEERRRDEAHRGVAKLQRDCLPLLLRFIS